jgi:Tol biopolymer transport system component
MLDTVDRFRALGSALALVLGAAAPAWANGTTERVSVAPGGVQGNFGSYRAAISAGGRFVAFESDATNLVPGDTNPRMDVFVRDRRAGTIERVSLGRGGVQSNDDSYDPSISADGRFVAFSSLASNLVPGTPSGLPQVFVRDRKTARTELVSLGPGGVQGNDDSSGPAISADGRFVAFSSDSSNLVPRDTTDRDDVFVRDRLTGTTRRMSLGPGGVQSNYESSGPAISADGRFVAFASVATNLVPGDTNGQFDVFVRDRKTGTTRRVSLGQSGVEGDGRSGASFAPAISADGRFVAFDSEAGNLVPGDTNCVSDVFVRDRRAGTTERVSLGRGGAQGNGESDEPAISADGRFVAFHSYASNLVPGDTNRGSDVFVHDRETGTTRRVSLGPGGTQSNRESDDPAISADGRFVAFESDATDLVPRDTNDASDVFVRTPAP